MLLGVGGSNGSWQLSWREGHFPSGIWPLVDFCSSWLSVAETKHSGKEQLGEGKDCFWLTLPGHSLSLREVGTGTQARNHREQRLLAHSQTLACLAFCYSPEQCVEETVPPEKGRVLLQQEISATDIFTGQSALHSPISTFFSGDSRLCWIDPKRYLGQWSMLLWIAYTFVRVALTELTWLKKKERSRKGGMLGWGGWGEKEGWWWVWSKYIVRIYKILDE